MSAEPKENLQSRARSGKRAAVMVAHPGHELRIHGWLEQARPSVCVLTDGSGRTQRSRLDSTTTVLKAAGCTVGPLYGAMTDRELYSAVLDLRHDPFIRLVHDFSSMLVRENIEYVAGDAEERYNPAHDVCRMIINAAVRVVRRAKKRDIKNYDFALIAPSNHSAVIGEGTIRVELDELALARKIAAARNYPELHAEVSAALAGSGSVGLQQHPDLARQTGWDRVSSAPYDFAVECLRPIESDDPLVGPPKPEAPFYELYGERQVLAGHYDRVLRYHDHMRPLAESIQSYVEQS